MTSIHALVHLRRNNLRPADEHLHHALTLCRQIGDQASEAWTLTLLGAVDSAREDLERAVEQLHQALALSRQVGARVDEA